MSEWLARGAVAEFKCATKNVQHRTIGVAEMQSQFVEIIRLTYKKLKGTEIAPRARFRWSAWFYLRAASVISVVKAPVGSLVMTGSEPPPSSVLTVRS